MLVYLVPLLTYLLFGVEHWRDLEIWFRRLFRFWTRALRWLRSTVVRTSILTGELPLSCARPTVGQVTTSWVNCQPTRPTQPFILPGSVSE